MYYIMTISESFTDQSGGIKFLSDLRPIFDFNGFFQNKSTYYYCNGNHFFMYLENLVLHTTDCPFSDVSKFIQSGLPWLAPGSLSAHGMQLDFSKL